MVVAKLSMKGKTFKKIVRDLQGCGYNIQWKVYNAKDFNVPQSRRRIYILGMKPWMHMPELPEPPYKAATPCLSDFLDDDIGTKSDRPPRGTAAATNLKLLLGGLKAVKAHYKKETYCLDIDSSSRFVTVKHEIAPALLHSRPKGHPKGLVLFTISMLMYS